MGIRRSRGDPSEELKSMAHIDKIRMEDIDITEERVRRKHQELEGGDEDESD
jgi:hypothetical protein